MDLLGAEITAVTGKDPGEHFQELVSEFGMPYYTRVDAAATPEQKAKLQKLSSKDVKESYLAGEPILNKLSDESPLAGVVLSADGGHPGGEGAIDPGCESFDGDEHLAVH